METIFSRNISRFAKWMPYRSINIWDKYISRLDVTNLAGLLALMDIGSLYQRYFKPFFSCLLNQFAQLFLSFFDFLEMENDKYTVFCINISNLLNCLPLWSTLGKLSFCLLGVIIRFPPTLLFNYLKIRFW